MAVIIGHGEAAQNVTHVVLRNDLVGATGIASEEIKERQLLRVVLNPLEILADDVDFLLCPLFLSNVVIVNRECQVIVALGIVP